VEAISCVVTSDCQTDCGLVVATRIGPVVVWDKDDTRTFGFFAYCKYVQYNQASRGNAGIKSIE
jgi:hypothetical protein